MLIVFSGKPDGHFQYRGFVNMNCVDSAYVGIDCEDDKPFLFIGEAMITFQTLGEAKKMFDDIVAAYARGDKVFYIK